jgi:hypothetical protein
VSRKCLVFKSEEQTGLRPQYVYRSAATFHDVSATCTTRSTDNRTTYKHYRTCGPVVRRVAQLKQSVRVIQSNESHDISDIQLIHSLYAHPSYRNNMTYGSTFDQAKGYAYHTSAFVIIILGSSSRSRRVGGYQLGSKMSGEHIVEGSRHIGQQVSPREQARVTEQVSRSCSK